MKILFVVPPPYLPNRLHRIRSFDLIKILSQKHEVHLIAATTQSKEPEEFAQIKKLCKSVSIIKMSKIYAFVNCLRFPNLPFEISYCYSSKMTEAIKKTIKNKKIDILYLKRLRSSVYFNNFNVPTILDTTDAMSMFYLKMAENHKFPKNIFYFLEAYKYRHYEKNTMEKVKNWIVCSEIDKKYLETISFSVKIYIIPNAVDTNYFSPLKTKTQENTLLLRGLMDKPVNIDAANFFAKDIFPKVLRKVKDAKLFIVGPNPHPSVLKLANKNIIVTGFVKDVREYISSTQVSICPVRIGTGTRHKIIQAWSMQKPVTSTTIGAEGLKYKDGENILLADTPEDFAQKILEIFKSNKLYNKLAKNGRKTVELNYSLKAVGLKIEKVLNLVKNEK